jgi:sentrin-specific protease 1
MQMLKERDVILCLQDRNRKSTWYFSSFFFSKLLGSKKPYAYQYKNVKNWSKYFDVFKMDKVIIPVNISNTHWTLLVMYIQLKEIHYYDSMSGRGKMYLKAALQWLVDEAREKKGISNYDISQWMCVDREPHVPQQMNGVDCGVFTTICADFVSDNLPLDYDQQHMPFFRRKITADILRGSLRYTIN